MIYLVSRSRNEHKLVKDIIYQIFVKTKPALNSNSQMCDDVRNTVVIGTNKFTIIAHINSMSAQSQHSDWLLSGNEEGKCFAALDRRLVLGTIHDMCVCKQALCGMH